MARDVPGFVTFFMVYEQLRMSLSGGDSLDLSTTAAIGQEQGAGSRRMEEKERGNVEGELRKGEGNRRKKENRRNRAPSLPGTI